MNVEKNSTVHQGPSSAVALAGRGQEEKRHPSSRGRYYVYAHRYASGGSRGVIFYIGKGTAGRKDKTSSGRNAHWSSIVKKYGFSSEVLFSSDDEDQCLKIEKCLIRKIGLNNLANKSVGGRKNSGWRHSAEWKRKASERMSGEGNPNFGKSPSDSQRASISESLKGRSSPKKGLLGNKWTEERKAEMKRLRSFRDERNPWLNVGKCSEDKKKKLSTPVETLCGIKFYGMNDAVYWLRKNGWPKAAHSLISRCCDPKSGVKTAYGYEWRKSDEAGNNRMV